MRGSQLPDGRIPVLLSAHEEDLIASDAAAILRYLGRRPGSADPAAVAATVLRTRRIRRHRAVLRAVDSAELVAGLTALAEGAEHPLVARSSNTSAQRVAFVLPGQGNQWPSMGADAYRCLPAYRAEADRCADAFAAAGLASPLPYLLGGAGQVWPQLQIQGAQFTHAVGLAQVWRSCGILPDLTVGHSLGEVAAAYLAGAVGLPDAVAVVAARAAVVDRLPGNYGMAVLSLGVAEARALIAETPGWLEVSVVNAPSSTVVSGDGEAVAAAVRLAEQRGIFVRHLSVDFPAHTTALEPLRGELAELLPSAEFADSPVEFIGSAHGGPVGAGTEFGDYWYANLRNTVRFDLAAEAAARRGAGIFVELSAHPALQYSLTELVDDATLVASGRRDQPVVEQLCAGIAAAAVANPGYRWSDLAPDLLAAGRPTLPEFPNAPMRAIHLWADPEPLPPVPGSGLTVAVEEWQPSAPQQPDAPAPRRLAILAADDDAVAQQLIAAATTHHGCDLVGPAEAEITVLIAPALATPDPATAIDEIVGGGGAAMLDYRRRIGARCGRVWLVTTGGERVGADDPVALPGQAALAAMHRCAGFEFPDSTFGHLDLPAGGIGSDAAHRCIDALLGDDTEVALRCADGGPRIHRRMLRAAPAPAPSAGADGAALDHVVITGGSGVVGLHYARYCIEQGARRVTLLSRNGVGQADLDRLTEGRAVQVVAPRCDLTDPEAVARAAAEYAGDGASLLIHAAGVARFGPHDQQTGPDLTALFGAKVVGLVHLAQLWPRRTRCRILLCSSISGVWGGAGHAAYAAANRILDVAADQLRAAGVDCTAVRWGLWPGSELAGADEIARIERAGLPAMDAADAVVAGLDHRGPDPLIFAADFDRLRIFFETQGMALPFVDLPDDGPVLEPGAADGGGAPASRSIGDVVRAELAAALSLGDPDSVDLDTALVDLGVDSLLALDLRTRLRRGTGRSVPLARLLGGITGTELVAALESENIQPENPARPDRSEKVEATRD